jgi:hypothetical protein
MIHCWCFIEHTQQQRPVVMKNMVAATATEAYEFGTPRTKGRTKQKKPEKMEVELKEVATNRKKEEEDDLYFEQGSYANS